MSADHPAGFAPAFYDRLVELAELGAFEPEWLIDIACSESGLNPQAINKEGGARGAWQMMPATLHNLGLRPDESAAFAHWPIEDQLPLTCRYMSEWKAHWRFDRWTSRAQMYLANFLPGYLGGGDEVDRVLARKGNFIYTANPGLDVDGDGTITVGDLERAIQRGVRAVGQRYVEAINAVAAARGKRYASAADALDKVAQIPNVLPVLPHKPGDD